MQVYIANEENKQTCHETMINDFKDKYKKNKVL